MELDATGATAVGSADTEPDEQASGLSRGAVVGRYLLLSELGAGAMGVVFAAYDPELDRRVALKLLLPAAGRGPDGAGSARLLREAQALAKLSHPNVVAVHDVGTHGDRVWIAMELVAGQTLGAWAKAQTRRWPERLRVLTDVARGVAAAHAAGLVHRDLKPDNVMLDRDDRVRVMDFGLAHGRGAARALDRTIELDAAPPEPLAPTVAGHPGAHPEFAALAARLTRIGAIQGTPAYMAPEQWRGEETDAAADQFGWSVMAWEILYGARPFFGETPMALASAVLSGQRRPPPRGSRVPVWLRRVVERGLAPEASARWPSMRMLLTALERGRTRARMRTAAVVLACLALLGVAGAGWRWWSDSRREATCEAEGAALDGVWHEAARQAVRAAFVATGVSYAETTAQRVFPWLDRQAAAWKQARTDLCMNADRDGRWDGSLVDRASWCLEDRQMELEALVEELGQPNATTVQRAVATAASLRSVADCLDEGMLQRQPAPPADGRAAFLQVRIDLSRIYAHGIVGNYQDALLAATRIRESEAVRGWLPLWTVARAQEGEFLMRTGAYVKAEAASTDAYFEAARVGSWDVAADAAMDLVFDVGMRLGRPAEGQAWARHATLATAYAGDREGLRRAKILDRLAITHQARGANAEARELFEQALAIRERALGGEHPDVATTLNGLGQAHGGLGELAKGQALLERAVDIVEKAYGVEHPDYGVVTSSLADVHMKKGEYAEARALWERSLAIFERTLVAGHPNIVNTLSDLMAVHEAAGSDALAIQLGERVLAIEEHLLGPAHSDVAPHLVRLARVHLARGRPLAALPLLERAVAIFAADPEIQPDEPGADFALARALVATHGDRARAQTAASRARDGYRDRGEDEARAEVDAWLTTH